MAAPPPIGQIRVEDIVDESGGLDLDRLVRVLNQFIGPVRAALAGGINDENRLGRQKTLLITTRASLDDSFGDLFSLDGLASIRGVEVRSAVDLDDDSWVPSLPPTAKVVPTGDGRAKLQYVSGLDVNRRYRLTLWISG